jgi:hypothetical protein
MMLSRERLSANSRLTTAIQNSQHACNESKAIVDTSYYKQNAANYQKIPRRSSFFFPFQIPLNRHGSEPKLNEKNGQGAPCIFASRVSVLGARVRSSWSNVDNGSSARPCDNVLVSDQLDNEAKRRASSIELSLGAGEHRSVHWWLSGRGIGEFVSLRRCSPCSSSVRLPWDFRNEALVKMYNSVSTQPIILMSANAYLVNTSSFAGTYHSRQESNRRGYEMESMSPRP